MRWLLAAFCGTVSVMKFSRKKQTRSFQSLPPSLRLRLHLPAPRPLSSVFAHPLSLRSRTVRHGTARTRTRKKKKKVGVALASLTGDQRLQDTLLMVFSGERFKSLLDCSLNSLNEDVNSFTRDLPNLEKSLFNAGYRTSEEYVGWKSRAFNKLATSKVIQGKVKRQRL